MAKIAFYGSLARRILSVTFILIVIPMVIYAYLSWDRDWRIHLRTTLSQLELMAYSHQDEFEHWKGFRHEDLTLFSKEGFTSIEIPSSLSSLFVVEGKKFKESSTLAMVGKPLFFHAEAGSFVADNPYTQQEEIFLLKKIDGALWGLSEEVSQWKTLFAAFEEAGYPTTLTFIEKGQTPTTKGGVVLSLDRIGTWKKKILSLRGEDIALRVPLEGAHFDLLIEIPAAKVTHARGTGFFGHLILFFSLFLLLGAIGTFWLVSRMARPLNQLSHVMHAVEAQNYAKRYKAAPLGFEINVLGETFNRMLDALVRNMEEAKNERVARELLERELDIGRQIQQELLPKEIPQFPGLKVGGGFIPAKEVGGDFYDLFPIDDQHLFLTIADGSDKGISACLYALIVRSMLRSHAIAGNDLKKIVMATNDLFCHDTGMTGNFVTAWMAIFNKESKTLSFTSAGHCPAIYIGSGGEVEELNTQGIALGVEEGAEFEVKEKILVSDSLLLLYTDGVIEAHNEKGELFEKSRLIEFLTGRRALGPQALIDKLLEEINQFSKGLPQHDDLTVLSIQTDFSDRL